MIIEGRVSEFEDGLGDIVTRGFDWNIVVLLEVDTGLLLGWVVSYAEELTLETRIRRSGNVLSITPCSITSTTSRGWASTSTG